MDAHCKKNHPPVCLQSYICKNKYTTPDKKWTHYVLLNTSKLWNNKFVLSKNKVSTKHKYLQFYELFYWKTNENLAKCKFVVRHHIITSWWVPHIQISHPSPHPIFLLGNLNTWTVGSTDGGSNIRSSLVSLMNIVLISSAQHNKIVTDALRRQSILRHLTYLYQTSFQAKVIEPVFCFFYSAGWPQVDDSPTPGSAAYSGWQQI